MNTKPTRMLFAAVALSALAAVLASSAQARIPEGSGTQQSPQGSRTFFVANEQQVSQASGTFYFFTPDPKLYEIYGAPTSTVASEQQVSQGTELLEPRLARHRGGTLVHDEVCANLDRAIRLAIQQCLSRPLPLAAKQIRTGAGQPKKFPDGYRGLP